MGMGGGCGDLMGISLRWGGVELSFRNVYVTVDDEDENRVFRLDFIRSPTERG